MRYKALVGTWCLSFITFINILCKQQVSERMISGREFYLGVVCNGEIAKRKKKISSKAQWWWGNGVTKGCVLPYKYPDLPNAPSLWAPPSWWQSAWLASPQPAQSPRSLAEQGSCPVCWNGQPKRAKMGTRRKSARGKGRARWLNSGRYLPQGGAVKGSICVPLMTILNTFTLQELTSYYLWRVDCLKQEIIKPPLVNDKNT